MAAVVVIVVLGVVELAVCWKATEFPIGEDCATPVNSIAPIATRLDALKLTTML